MSSVFSYSLFCNNDYIMMTQLTIKCVIREISTFYSVRARMCMCGSGSSILLAFVHTRAKLA